MSTILTEVSTFTPTVITPNPGEPIKASDTIGTSYLIAGVDFNGGVIYVGKNPNVRVRHLGGISMALAVTVLGDDITVQLATDGTGNVLSTANQVVTAFNLVVAATTRATATVQGTGTSIAGIMTGFMKIGDDTFGSIRPALQSLANRTRYLFNKVIGMLFGTLTFKSLKVDGTGDLAAVSSPGDISSSRDINSGRDISSIRDIFSGRDTVSQRHITSNTGNISALSGNIQTVVGDIISGDQLIGESLQLNDAGGGTTLPTPTIPLGVGYIGNIVRGAASIDAAGSLVYGININDVTKTAKGKYTVKLNNNCQHPIVCCSVGQIVLSQAFAQYEIVTTTPLTISISIIDTAVGFSDRNFSIIVVGE